MIGALTSKKTLASILGTFTKTLTELDEFIKQNDAAVLTKTDQIENLHIESNALIEERNALIKEGIKAMKVSENIHPIIGR